MDKYIFFIIIVIILIIIICILYNLKKKTESFSNYSQYSKQKILSNCADSWAKIYPQSDPEKACESQAWITNPKYLCGICGDSEKNPLYSFQPNNDTSLPRLFGCSPSASNKLGLSWQQGATVNPLNSILSDKLTCDFQDINAVGDMYMYIYADDYCYVSLNGTQIISKSGWNSIGVYYLQNIKYGDAFSCELVNVCAPGGINVCYIWNKQLFIMDENGFENCANIIKYKATGTTGWSTYWVDYVTNPLPWMTNWLTCPYVDNCSGGESSATITFKVGDFANQETLNNDLVGFVGIDNDGSVYYNNTLVLDKTDLWTNVAQFTIPNVNFMDTLEIQCVNTGGPGAVGLSYLWCGQLFTIPNNLENFNKVANIITYTGSNLNTGLYAISSGTVNGNLQFVTSWVNACYGDCNFTLSAFIGYNPWSYEPSSGEWYTIVQNNNVGTWSDLPLISNSQMTISFWINLSTINAEWRNIFHFSNDNVNCCNVGNRVPALWVWPSSSNLYLVNDLENAGNQNYINPSGISLNTPVFITLVWSGVTVNSYVNGVLQQSATYPTNIEPITSNTIFYIGDPWYIVDGGVQICNFEISNFALPASYISEIYNLQSGSLPPIIMPDIQCSASYGETTLCCGQENTGNGTPDAQYTCPSNQPTCSNYVYDVQWGTCG
jgi:hypothetical protein